MPTSFPLARFDALSKLLGEASHLRGWGRCIGGLNGVAIRYRGAVEAHEKFKAVFAASFGGDDWYAEEDAVYSLFMHGVSTIECAAFAAFHLGAIICDSALPTAVSRVAQTDRSGFGQTDPVFGTSRMGVIGDFQMASSGRPN